MRRWNSAHLSRVYPEGTRIGSGNVDPVARLSMHVGSAQGGTGPGARGANVALRCADGGHELPDIRHRPPAKRRRAALPSPI